MSLFGKKKKGKGQNKDALIPVEQIIIPTKKPSRTRPNLCLMCEKYSIACPYGTNTYSIACSDFVQKGSKTVSKEGALCCPNCGSNDLAGTYGGRHECKRYGFIFR
jgi:hypothetical protein